MPRVSKQVRDTKTGKEYPSMYKAGLALYKLAGPDGSKDDHFVWYKIVKRHPSRFEIKEAGSKKWHPVKYVAKAKEMVEEEEDVKANAKARLASTAAEDKARRVKAAKLAEAETEEDEDATSEVDDEDEDEDEEEDEDEALQTQLKASVKAASKGKTKKLSKVTRRAS